MKIVRHFIHTVLGVANIIVGAGYLVCAYSPYISPVHHPVWACAGLFFPLFIALNVILLFVCLCVRRRMALFPLLVFIAGWSSLRTYFPINGEKDVEGRCIKLLTYNTQAIARGDKPNDKEEENPILSYLRQSDADIICLQEFRAGGNASQKEIDKALSTYPYRQVDGSMACYSRYPILSAERIDYPSQHNNSMLYRLEVDEDTVVVVNNHLESNKLDNDDKQMYKDLLKSPDEEKVKNEGKHLLLKLADAVAIRAPQADSVALSISRNQTGYMLVCGDFNDSPVSYAHRVIGKGLKDAFVSAGSGPGFSYNRNRLYFRIDHIFVSPAFDVRRCEVDQSIDASDHYPVWCIVAFKK